MFRLLIERRPFISGLVIGFIGTRIIGKKLKRILPEGITVIQIMPEEAPDKKIDEEN